MMTSILVGFIKNAFTRYGPSILDLPAIEISLLLEWLPSRKQTINVCEDVGKMETSYIDGGNVN
jgi:hypothetical protein